MKPQQRVILYRHGLPNNSEKRKAERKAKYYRENSGREYFPCPGNCGTEVSLVNGKVISHYADRKNRIRCSFKGEVND